MMSFPHCYVFLADALKNILSSFDLFQFSIKCSSLHFKVISSHLSLQPKNLTWGVTTRIGQECFVWFENKNFCPIGGKIYFAPRFQSRQWWYNILIYFVIYIPRIFCALTRCLFRSFNFVSNFSHLLVESWTVSWSLSVTKVYERTLGTTSNT